MSENMVYPDNKTRNRVLDCLSNADFDLLAPHLEEVALGFRKRLQSSNRIIDTVYFPDSGLGSVVAVGRGREPQIEVALVGREGMTGLPIVHGTDRSPYEIFIQVEGDGRQISSASLRDAMARSPTMRNCFLLYSHTFYIQSGYTALANAQGTLEQRLARWLLMAQDRLESHQLMLTHEFLALMLGVRRAGVSVALQHFEGKGLTQGERGAVTIIDRDGLEEMSDGFYGPPEAEYERVFPSSGNQK
jgi:CRP-like cAMP-binding protein